MTNRSATTETTPTAVAPTITPRLARLLRLDGLQALPGRLDAQRFGNLLRRRSYDQDVPRPGHALEFVRPRGSNPMSVPMTRSRTVAVHRISAGQQAPSPGPRRAPRPHRVDPRRLRSLPRGDRIGYPDRWTGRRSRPRPHNERPPPAGRTSRRTHLPAVSSSWPWYVLRSVRTSRRNSSRAARQRSSPMSVAISVDLTMSKNSTVATRVGPPPARV